MMIGIDLGTTNSLAAYFTEKGPKIIPNRLGKHLTPSVVSIDEKQQIFVGETAREMSILEPRSGASVFKRSMGSAKIYFEGKEIYSGGALLFCAAATQGRCRTIFGKTSRRGHYQRSSLF